MPARREPNGMVRITAPAKLGVFQDRAPATIRFCSDIRRLTLEADSRHITIDFADCTAISRAACLIITAELKRAVHYFDGENIDVRTPRDLDLANLFEGFGVYKYFDVPSPLTAAQRRKNTRDVIVVRSGGVGKEEVFEKLAEIASIASRVCGQASVAADVDEALQEAMFNAGEHAYSGVKVSTLPADRWWFAGLFDSEKSEAFFYALDHGIGIPIGSENTMAAELSAYWAADARFAAAASGSATDVDRLEAAIRAPRLDLKGRQGRGQGLPTMVGLIDTAVTGEVRILSGAAAWHSRRLKKAAAKGANTFDRCYRLREEFPGTLVCWRITGSPKPRP